MKTVGLMGGSDYKNTIKYIDAINQKFQSITHDDQTCKSIAFNLNQKDLSDRYLREIIYYSDVLRESGAGFLVLCDEMLHDISKDIRRNLSINLLHIGECVADRLVSENINKVLLIGPREKMQADYYIHAFNRAGIKVAIPPIKMINEIHDYLESERKDPVKMISLIESFRLKGVSGVVFTADMKISPYDLSMKAYYSFDIHVEYIVTEIMKGL